MKAEDLMIGNFVNHTDVEDTWVMTIETVMAEGCCTECNGIFDYIEAEHFKPIELTGENIVELLGFKFSNDWNCYYRDSFELYLKAEQLLFKNSFTIPLPKHVHKLQQLIKALEE